MAGPKLVGSYSEEALVGVDQQMDERVDIRIRAEATRSWRGEDLEERMGFDLPYKDWVFCRLGEPTHDQESFHQVLQAYAFLPQTVFFHCQQRRRNFGIHANASL